MIDTRCGCRSHLRLCMIRHAQACRLDHRDVIGAVSRYESLIFGNVPPSPELDESCKLGGPPEDRRDHFTGQPPRWVHRQSVGAALVKTDHAGDPLGEQREASGHQARIGAVAAHGRHQRPRAWREPDAAVYHFVNCRHRKSFEQRDALAKCRLEFDLPPHRPLGDR
jgi:hypothetical protein